MHAIKNILFDLGNVIVDFDIRQTKAKFRELVNTKEEMPKLINKTLEVFEKFERGAISEKNLVEELQSATSRPITTQLIRDTWNAMMIGLPFHRLQMLEQLKEKYRLFVLSNTSEMHMTWLKGFLHDSYGISDYESQYFEQVYYSYKIGMRKPDQAIFEFVLQDATIRAEETLFIDDQEKNIASALKLGFQTILHDPQKEVVAVLRSHLD